MRHWLRVSLGCTCNIVLVSALCVTQNKPESRPVPVNIDEVREHLTGDPPPDPDKPAGAPICGSSDGGYRRSGQG